LLYRYTLVISGFFQSFKMITDGQVNEAYKSQLIKGKC